MKTALLYAIFCLAILSSPLRAQSHPTCHTCPDFSDLIAPSTPGLKLINSRHDGSIHLGYHESHQSNLVLAGRPLQDTETGDVTGIACVGLQTEQLYPSCSVIRKYYFNARTKKLYFFSFAYHNSTATPGSAQALKSASRYILKITSYMNTGNGPRPGSTVVKNGFLYDFTLQNSIRDQSGWNWGENVKSISHRKFRYFTESLMGHGMPEWSEEAH